MIDETSKPIPAEAQQASPHPADRPIVEASGLGKTYGSTLANADLSFVIARGEVIGLVGANGAGKSTLMRVLCGVTAPDTGRLAIGGEDIAFSAHTPRTAQARGIRIVWQELSLLPNLTVAENFYVERPDETRSPYRWRGTYGDLAERSLEAIFPGAGISPARLVADLTLAERQMVEIARAAGDPGLRLLVLDEPTSSLGAERSGQLRRFIAERAAAGIAVVFISHKLSEVLDVADRVLAMRNGRLVFARDAAQTTIGDLVAVMGGAAIREDHARRVAASARDRTAAPVLVRIEGEAVSVLGHPVELRAGEIVGLAGLEGGGQKPLLQAIFDPSASKGAVVRSGRASFVSGDRQREGVFPLWSVLQNISIGRIARMAPLKPVRERTERDIAGSLAQKLGLDRGRLESDILDLSGGNQQKAIVARALADDAAIVLLDDPTRGVDVGAKRDFYGLVGDMAGDGRLVVWHSTEDLEFLECDRVLVFSGRRIVRELQAGEISEEAIVAASFEEAGPAAGPARPRRAGRFTEGLFAAVPFASLVVVFALMVSLNPRVASSFGLELLLGPAVTLVLVALAQMFVVGGSEIDLGVGAFTGLVNVVGATLLVASPATGFLCLAGGLLAYAFVGWVIQARSIPAIVVTLGTSFVFAGLGQTIQPSPGGSAPDWLVRLVSLSVPGVPTPLLLIVLAGLVAHAIDRSRTGTILRAFGSAPSALVRSGWPPVRYAVLRYVIAGSFATVAGLYLTGANGASDINAGSSFTLLGIAAVVIGGCQLMGGVIAPLGTVAGAVTLALIGALLASLGVSTDFNAAVQGGLLIAILSLRSLADWRRRHD